MRTLCFIDAANLFYGGLKSLGWKIDYAKLRLYLIAKYQVEALHYFAGVEIYDFEFNSLACQSVPIKELVLFLELKLGSFRGNKKEFLELHKNYERAKFFSKLDDFGYVLHLKPVKTHFDKKGFMYKKADCDLDMAIQSIIEIENYDRVLMLSGDVDFLPLYKFLKDKGKEIIIMVNSKSTARDIKRFAGSDFIHFGNLREVTKEDEIV
jgi:uncharacterized LabA/DUF88 family protein